MHKPERSDRDEPATAPKGKLVVVLGMHRAGTSLATRALQVLGVDLGTNLLPEQPDNVSGFWEDVDVYSLNIEMLAALDMDWHSLSTIGDIDVATLRDEGFFIRAVELIRHKLEGRHAFGVKDPRMTKLMPLWTAVFDYCELDVGYVIAFRNPRSVARSLQARNQLPPETCYAMWLDHVITSLYWTQSRPRGFVDYDDLLFDPERPLQRLSRLLALTINPSQLATFRDEFIRLPLRHYRDQMSDLLQDRACFPLASEIYGSLLKLAKGEEADSDVAEQVDRWHHEFARQRPFLVLADHLSANAARLERELAKTTEKYESTLTNLQREAADYRERTNRLESELLGRVDDIAQTISQIQSHLNGQIVELTHAVADRDVEIARQHAAIETMRSAITEARTKAERAELEANVLQHQIDAVFGSTSWRVTAPIRRLVGAVRRHSPE